MRSSKLFQCVAIALICTFFVSGCTRRQLIPGLIAGGGAILTTSGAIYRATLGEDTDGAFGDTDGEIATTAVLIFGGIGLLITGVIWSLTSTHCETNSDCWSDDVCEQRTHTCIDVSTVRRRAPADEGEAEEEAEEAEDEEEAEEEAEEAEEEEG